MKKVFIFCFFLSFGITNLGAKNSKESSQVQKNSNQKPIVEKELKKTSSREDKLEASFKEFLKILSSHPKRSTEYKDLSSFVEKTFYDSVSFNSLKTLADLYLEKEDINSYLLVLQSASVSYPKNPEVFYLLGKAHKMLEDSLEDPEELEENTKKILKNYRTALQLNQKYREAYEGLLKEIMVFDKEKQKLTHTRDSLNLVMDMLKYLNDKKDYPLLCEAYYDNKFTRQTRKACVKSFKKNPNDPISQLILAFTLKDKKKREEKLLSIGAKYPNSFKTQYEISLYFQDISLTHTIAHLEKAHKVQPENLVLNERLARFLLKNGREEQAYPYYLKSCLLSEGVFLEEFKRTIGFLRTQKKEEELIETFNKGIKECYQTVKKNKKAEEQKEELLE